MNAHPTLHSLSATLVTAGRPHVQLLYVAAAIPVENQVAHRMKKKRSKQSTAAPEVVATEVSVTRERVSEEELRRRIASHNKIRSELREKERERERKRIDVELSRVEEDAIEVQRHEEERRRQREEELRDRLEAIQQRREKRELEHEVSKRRSRRTVEEPSSINAIKVKIEAQQREEDQRRKQILEEIHQRFHAPVTEGVAEARELLERSKEHARRRAAEMRRHREEVDESAQSFYQGKHYEGAMRQFARARHEAEDHKHDRLYRLAKMNEYAKVVGEMSKRTQAQQQETAVCRSAPIMSHQQQPAQGLSVDERRKQGDDFMRNAGARKLPPGLKLQPLKSPVDENLVAEVGMVKEREKKGLQYLRELREKVELVRGSKKKEVFNKSEFVDEIKQIRIQTNLMERKLLYGQQQQPQAQQQPASTTTTGSNVMHPEEHEKRRNRGQQIHFTGESSTSSLTQDETSSYIDVVNAKLAMLRKLEELRRRAPRDDSKW